MNIEDLAKLQINNKVSDLSVVNSAQMLSRINEETEKMNEQLRKVGEERFERVEETRKNIRDIAQNANETNQLLKDLNKSLLETNELLVEKNEQLEDSLIGMTEILKSLFADNLSNWNNQIELMRQANALACEIAVSLDKGEKINWKDKAADVGVQTVVSAIGLLLRMKGIII